ncbi:MAG: hypothetical protein ACOVP4_02695 [Bacteriovoracaceae bacterium]|jgi:hypothetical protein
MKHLILIGFVISTSALALDQFGNLDEKDQKYFQNDSREGKNQLERIDANVRQINTMMGDIIQMKKDIAELKAEINALKSDSKGMTKK